MKSGGDGAGVTRAAKGVKIMALVDARGLPVAVETRPASPHEFWLVQGLFNFTLTADTPQRIFSDKAYHSARLAKELANRGV